MIFKKAKISENRNGRGGILSLTSFVSFLPFSKRELPLQLCSFPCDCTWRTAVDLCWHLTSRKEPCLFFLKENMPDVHQVSSVFFLFRPVLFHKENASVEQVWQPKHPTEINLSRQLSERGRLTSSGVALWREKKKNPQRCWNHAESSVSTTPEQEHPKSQREFLQWFPVQLLCCN